MNTRYRFTVKELQGMSNMTPSALRHRVTKLVERRAIICVGTLRPQNSKVYVSTVDPLVLLELEEPRPMPYNVKEISGFWNNPFNLKGAIDMRWKL
jgi:hypothetical protein